MAIINGTAVANTLNGTAGNDTINGLAGNDTLNGNAGNDILDGGTGADKMKGNAGNDTYVVDSTGDLVTELASQGTADLVKASITYTLGLNVENLTLTGAGNINGTGNTLNNVITGNTGNNILSGSSGNDTLNGGTGNDTLDGGVGNDILDGGTGSDKMTGGTGNDTIKVDSTGDTVTELASGGTDVVQTGLDYSLAALVNVENLTLTGTAAVDGTGNLGNNIITGNSNANVLNGRAGNDTLHGNGGEDVLLGLAGNDTLNGGDGNDELLGSAGDDILNGGANDDMLSGGSGNDTLDGGEGSDELQGNAGDDILNGGVDDDLLTGGIGNDTLDGGADADILIGHGGNDTLVWDEGDFFLNGGGGDDTLQVNGTGQTLDLTAIPNGKIQNVEIVNITGSGNNTLTLEAEDVLAMSSTDTLRVDGNAGDVVFRGPGWTSDGTTVINTNTYSVYTNGGATLQVRDLIESNHAPEGSSNEVAVSDVDATHVFAVAEFGFSDPVDGNEFAAVKISTLPLGGTLLLTDTPVVAGDFITVEDIDAGNLTFVQDEGEDLFGILVFNFQVQDDGGTANGGVDLDPSPNSMAVNLLAGNYIGTAGPDSFTGGGSFFETIRGLGGNDILNGGAGSNTIWGGSGDDTITSDGDFDTLVGGLGADSIDIGPESGINQVVYNNTNEGAAQHQETGYDSILGFDISTDRIAFDGAAALALDDGADEGVLTFVTNAAVDFSGAVDEALLIFGGFSDADLLDLDAVCDFANTYALTANEGDDGLIVVQGNNHTGIYYHLEDGLFLGDFESFDMTLIAIVDSALLDQNNFFLGLLD